MSDNQKSVFNVEINIPRFIWERIGQWLEKHALWLVVPFMLGISISAYLVFYHNGLGLAYNDARSHLNIGRRVVEGLQPGFAQIGSVWLPLTHILMIPTIWMDWAWHSGFAGALQSMVAFVFMGVLIYKFLQEVGVGIWARFAAIAVFVVNLNILYLQSTAMTELLLLAMMTAGAYYLLLWQKYSRLVDLVKSAFWVMCSTLIRYDGWFLMVFVCLLLFIDLLRRKGYRVTEGLLVMFGTLAGMGVVLWFGWNWLIFNDPLYFAFGPFSAHAQQSQIEAAGELLTKHDLLFSMKVYTYALVYNSGLLLTILGLIGAIYLWIDKRLSVSVRIATLSLIAPLIFNVLALYMGHSVLFIGGISGKTWFNVRYGVMLMPSLAIFFGFLIDRLKSLRWTIVGLWMITAFFAFTSYDAVTIDDATVGSSQKNVTEVSGWLAEHAGNESGFVLISAASHDAIIFSSGLPMKRFIHEGTGKYWDWAVDDPDQWARWIIMRTHDDNDLTFRSIKDHPDLENYDLVGHFPFSDIYELKPQYLSFLSEEAGKMRVTLKENTGEVSFPIGVLE